MGEGEGGLEGRGGLEGGGGWGAEGGGEGRGRSGRLCRDHGRDPTVDRGGERGEGEEGLERQGVGG